MSNSVDPDEMAHYELSNLDLRCLPKRIIIAKGSDRIKKVFVLFFLSGSLLILK